MSTISSIAASLSTPYIPSRRVATDILTFMCYSQGDPALFDAVNYGFDALSTNNGGGGRYEYWLRSFLDTISGRGKMGSMVGASDDLRRHGGADSHVNEYSVRDFFLTLKDNV
jgi:cytokinesis protein